MELNERHWVKTVENWKVSGLTKSEYCRREGINRSTFSTWWRRYKAQVKESSNDGFVEITPKKEIPSEGEKLGSTYPAEIQAAGFTVRIAADAEEHFIETIFKALEARLCS